MEFRTWLETCGEDFTSKELGPFSTKIRSKYSASSDSRSIELPTNRVPEEVFGKKNKKRKVK